MRPRIGYRKYLIRHLADAPVSEVHSFVRRVSAYRDVHAALIVFENECVAQLSANYTTDARLERYEIHGRDISAYLEGIRGGEFVCDGGVGPACRAWRRACSSLASGNLELYLELIWKLQIFKLTPI